MMRAMGMLRWRPAVVVAGLVMGSLGAWGGSFEVVGHLDMFADYGAAAVSGDYAFVAGASNMKTVDISVPESPDMVHSFGISGDTIGAIAVDGNLLYVMSSGMLKKSGLLPRWVYLDIFDVTDPGAPVRLSAYDDFPGDACGGIVVRDGLVYATAYSTGLLGKGKQVLSGALTILDVSDPENPAEVGEYALMTGFTRLAVEGDLAYVGTGTMYTGALETVDVSNPAAPSWVHTWSGPGPVTSVKAAGGLVYVGWGSPLMGNGGLRILDTSNPQSPSEVGSYDTGLTVTDLVLMDEVAFVALYGMGVVALDVSIPGGIEPAGAFTPGLGSVTLQLACAHGRVYLPTDDEGFYVLDYVVEGMEVFSELPCGGWFEEGDSLCLGVALAEARNDVAYAWTKDGAALPEATDTSYCVESLKLDDGGTYVCEVRTGAKTRYVTPGAVVHVFAAGALPVGGGVGLTGLAGALVFGGMVWVRRFMK